MWALNFPAQVSLCLVEKCLSKLCLTVLFDISNFAKSILSFDFKNWLQVVSNQSVVIIKQKCKTHQSVFGWPLLLLNKF